MPRIALGTHVMAGRVRGVVVRHSPQGMVDIQPEGEDFIVRKRESDLRRTNPQRGAPSARVRHEVEKMLHNPPSSWKALYRRAGLSARPSADDFIDMVRSKTPSGRSAEAYYGQEMGEGRHVPPKAVRAAALHGLRLSYDNNYTSKSGVGLARAVQLVLDPSIDDLAKTRMRAYLIRHEKDKQGKNFGNDRNPSNGYMAWLNWGGDPAQEWLEMKKNPIFGFGRKRAKKPSVDPMDSFEAAVGLYREYAKTADSVLVLASNKRGTGTAWYWLDGPRGISVRSFEGASTYGSPQRYIEAKDPTSTVIRNLQAYRNPGRITYITVDAFTGKVTGPFKGSEILPPMSNPRSAKPDVMEKQEAQFQAVVQGIYESLMAKRLGVKSIYPSGGGERLDLTMLRMGTLSKKEVRDTLSRAFAIATQQGQKHGDLVPGSQKPTPKGRRRAYARHKDAKSLGQNQQDYEQTLSLSRKSSPLRVVQRGRGSSKRFFVEPHVSGVNKRGYKTQSGAERALDRVMQKPRPSRANPGMRAGPKVGDVPLYEQRRKINQGYFSSPGLRVRDSQGKAVGEYVTAADPDGKTLSGPIEYRVKGGKLVIIFQGYEYWAAIPGDYESLVRKSETPEDAEKMMKLLGRPIHGTFREENGKLTYSNLTPAEMQNWLDSGRTIEGGVGRGTPSEVARAYRRLAHTVLNHGFFKDSKDNAYVSPTIALSEVTDKNGRTFLTYTVFGINGEARVSRAKDASGKGAWEGWKDIKGEFSPVKDAVAKEDKHQVHETLSKTRTGRTKKEWYVFGPLSKYGTGDSRKDRQYDKEMREWLNTSAQIRAQRGMEAPEPPSMFIYKKKKDATSAARLLDKKWARTRQLMQPGIKGAYGFFVKFGKRGDDYGYQYASALAEKLSNSSIAYSGPGPKPRSIRKESGDSKLLNEKFRTPGVFFEKFPWRRYKGEKVAKDVVSPQPPNLAVFMPGTVFPVQKDPGEEAASFQKKRKKVMDALTAGTFPYGESEEAVGHDIGITQLIDTRTITKGPRTGEVIDFNIWDDAARSLAQALNALNEAKENAGNLADGDKEVQAAKKWVGQSAGKAKRLMAAYDLRDRPVVILLGLASGGGLTDRRGTIVVKGPGRQIIGRPPGMSNRDWAQRQKDAVIIRSAVDDSVFSEGVRVPSDHGYVEKKGTGSGVLNAVAFLVNWKPGPRGEVFEMPIFMAQVRNYQSLIRRAKEGSVPGYSWAQAKDPSHYLSRAFVRPDRKQ